MKKTIAVFLAVCLSAFSISACSGSTTSVETNSGANASDAAGQSEQTQSVVDGSSGSVDEGGSEDPSAASADGSSSQSSSKTSEAQTSKQTSSQSSSSKSGGESSKTGNSQSSKTGNGQSSKTGNGQSSNTGNSGSSNIGNSGSSNTGNSGSSKTGNSGSSKTGNSGSSNTGNSGSANTGNSGSSNTGNRGNSNTGNSGSSNTGNSGSSNTGNSGSSNTGNSGGSTTTTTSGDIGGIALYNQLFNLNNVVTVEVSISQNQIDKLNADYNKYHGNDKKSDIYRMADVTFKVGSQKYSVDEVGVRLKGNQSMDPLYENGKPNLVNLKLSFDEAFDDKSDYGSDAKTWSSDAARKARKQRKFASMNELDIKYNVVYDQTQIKEVYATKLFESADVLVQKVGLAQLKINGKNYGLVRIFEPVDKTFLEKRLPASAIGGDLYKCMWSNRTSGGGITGWRGATYKTDNSYGVQNNKLGIKYNFNLKTNKSTSNHAKLKNFLNVINKANPTKAEIESVLDVDYYARFMAACYFAGDPDDIRNNYNNHYIYFRKDNGKAIFIVYDNDRTLGITNGMSSDGSACSKRNPYSSSAAAAGGQENPLIKKTITHDATANLQYIRDKYSAALAKLAATPMLTSSSDFNSMFNLAKSNYNGIVSVSGFKNQKESYSFNLNASNNMTFDTFRSNILAAYKSGKP